MTLPRPLLLAAGVLTATLLGYALAALLLGPATRSQQRPAPTLGAAQRSTAGAVTVTPVGPRRVDDGVPRGFARSRLGAVAAATNYLTMLQRSLSAGAVRWRAVVRALTAPPLSGQALVAAAAAAAIARRLSRSGAPTFISGWALGYRIDAYGPSQARVRVWTMGVMAGSAAVIAPTYSTTACRLTWIDGDWKVTGAQTQPGPSPPPDRSNLEVVSAFVTAATRFEAFSDAP